MTHEEIQADWDVFIEYPNGSGKLYVTTISALIFARCIAEKVAAHERDKCAKACESLDELCLQNIAAAFYKSADAIRARGNT